MRIDIPQSSYPRTRLTICTPLGQEQAEFSAGHTHYDYEIPEGVEIDSIAVRYDHFGNGRAPITGGVLKNAIAPPVVPPADPPAPIVPVVDIPEDAPVDDCVCVDNAACSQCDPEDAIAEPKDEESK